jgi:serine/threonine protein kinase
LLAYFNLNKGFLNIQQEDLEVHDWLGNGCSGVVFQGVFRHNGEQEHVAIKKVITNLHANVVFTRSKIRVSSRDIVDDICKELTMMQNLLSEHICKLYGACLFNSCEAWLVMEYIDGGDLHHYLNKYGGPLPRDIQLSFFIQATKALHSLHTAPTVILHRDIKSLNFLVQNKTKLLLTDFGLSKAKSHLNTSSVTVGTVRWAAPEIVSTSKPQWSEKADIYSLGMVFYEIVTQTLPYQDESSLTSILKKIKTGVLPKLPPDCPKVNVGTHSECNNNILYRNLR